MGDNLQALVALLVRNPEELHVHIRTSGLSEASLVRLVAKELDEFDFCRWWEMRGRSADGVDGIQAPNPDVRSWASQKQIINTAIEVYRQSGSNGISGWEGSILANELLEVPGVAAVILRSHELTIEKFSTFTWDDIAPRITDVIRNFNS